MHNRVCGGMAASVIAEPASAVLNPPEDSGGVSETEQGDEYPYGNADGLYGTRRKDADEKRFPE